MEVGRDSPRFGENFSSDADMGSGGVARGKETRPQNKKATGLIWGTWMDLGWARSLPLERHTG